MSPFVRHSSLTELQRFVSIFKPRTLFPNTTQASLGFAEYHAMPVLFHSALHKGGSERLKAEAIAYSHQHRHRTVPLDLASSQVLNRLLNSLQQPDLDKIFSNYDALASLSAEIDPLLEDSLPADPQTQADVVALLRAPIKGLISNSSDLSWAVSGRTSPSARYRTPEVIDLTSLPDTASLSLPSRHVKQPDPLTSPSLPLPSSAMDLYLSGLGHNLQKLEYRWAVLLERLKVLMAHPSALERIYASVTTSVEEAGFVDSARNRLDTHIVDAINVSRKIREVRQQAMRAIDGIQ